MGKPVNSNVQRAKTIAINTQVNKEVLDNFRDCLGKYGYPMNLMLETFMRQYSNGKFDISINDIWKFENGNAETDALATMVNRKIYTKFKSTCRDNGFFVKYVLTAFMEKYATENYILEYVDTSKKAKQ